MPDPDAKRTKKVSHSAIDEIRSLGMGKAIKKYTSGEGSPEFRTAVERYYSPQRLKGASKEATKAASAPAAPKSEPKSVPMPPSAPAAANRKTKPHVTEVPLNNKKNSWKGKKSPLERLGTKLADMNEKSFAPLPWNKPGGDKKTSSAPKSSTPKVSDKALRKEAWDKGFKTYTKASQYVKEQRSKGR